MASIKDKYVPVNLQDITRSRVSMCVDCGCLVGSQFQHNKACIVVREGQIKE